MTVVVIALLAGGVVVGGWAWYALVTNPRVAQELREEPDGERARRVMLLTLPSGRELPVNYFQEGDLVWAGADGRWWRELEGEGEPVTVLVRGAERLGTARAVLDDPAYTEEVFAKLRPNAVKGFGTLVEIRLAEASRSTD